MASNCNYVTKKSKAFSERKINSVLLKLAIPSMISLLVAELYNMVDTIFVGRAIGSTAIGALTIAFPVQRLIIAIGMLLAVGASTALARSLGEGNYGRIKYIVMSALTLMILGISSLTGFIYIFKSPIIYHLGATDNIFPYAHEYISIVVFGGLFQCFTVIIGYMLIALGNAKTNLYATTIGAVSNIILDYILVVILSYGIKGAAIATVMSQIISAFYAFYYFLRIKNKFNMSFGFNLKKDITVSILSVGFSTFIIEISDAVVACILNNLLSSRGDMAIIIVGVISKVSMFLFITVIGISSAMQPIAAYNYGAKNFKRLREVVRKTIIAVTVASSILWIIMLLFANPIISSFVKDEAILNHAVKAFRIVILVFPSISVYYVAIYYYQSIKEAKLSLILSIYRQLVIFIPALFILVSMFGLIGAWVAYPVSDFLSALTGFYYINRAKADIKEKQRKFTLLKTLPQLSS